ncbi:hypothetical protein DFJ43DRAFT_1105830 [Lentinula guzmanii]|uniref:DUF726-domain-containing protein n=1 Tax=Lentinula guzmanii TaxID=2804957 RepID=A0AA38J9Z4_9AGAR|nr:hypothetical protein DFJ43DRAFT_1105830 [Lentinula guzmanii]
MIESLGRHGVKPIDLVPPLVEMKEVVNPDSDGPEYITLDMRYTILTSLFLLLIADSVYDSRSRALFFRVGALLSLSAFDVLLFEGRIVEAVGVSGEAEGDLGEGEGGEGGLGKNEGAVEEQVRKLRRRRIAMLGLATLGGGLVIGLSAGLLAPVIGVGLGTAFSTIGIGGASTFLAGSTGAAVITTGGVLTGAGIAGKGMSRRTQVVRVFDVLPIHRNGRVGCVLSVPGFLNGKLDDPRLPFSVLDPVVGDVFSVLWEPEMIRETGSALSILTGEVLSQISQTVLQATVMATLMTALQWPIILTKLGYLIDNPWSNALDRARAAGLVLASILRERKLGVRPITLVGFSLGARVIFYALLDLARTSSATAKGGGKGNGNGNGGSGFGIVQDVYLMGATISVPLTMWEETRGVVGGRYVNVYARNDWVLNYLFRASSAVSGNVNTVAGLRPILGVQGLENHDVTDKIAGHMSYRVYMPLILEDLGFKITQTWFDEVEEEPDFEGERGDREGEEERGGEEGGGEGKGWFARRKARAEAKKRAERRKAMEGVQRPPSYATWAKKDGNKKKEEEEGEEVPQREPTPFSVPTPLPLPPTPLPPTSLPPTSIPTPPSVSVPVPVPVTDSLIPKTAGFDLDRIKAELRGVSEGEGGVSEPLSTLSTLSISPSPPPPLFTSSTSTQSVGTPSGFLRMRGEGSVREEEREEEEEEEEGDDLDLDLDLDVRNPWG